MDVFCIWNNLWYICVGGFGNWFVNEIWENYIIDEYFESIGYFGVYVKVSIFFLDLFRV